MELEIGKNGTGGDVSAAHARYQMPVVGTRCHVLLIAQLLVGRHLNVVDGRLLDQLQVDLVLEGLRPVTCPEKVLRCKKGYCW